MSKQASRPPTEALEASAAVTSAPSTGRLRGGTLSWPAWGRQVRCDFVAPREMFKGLKSSSKSHNRSCHSRTGAHIGEWAAGPRRFVHRSCLTFDGKYCYFNVYARATRAGAHISYHVPLSVTPRGARWYSPHSPVLLLLYLNYSTYRVGACRHVPVAAARWSLAEVLRHGPAAARTSRSIAAQHHVTTGEAVLYAC